VTAGRGATVPSSPRSGGLRWLTANLTTFSAYFLSGAVSVLWLNRVASHEAVNAATALAIPWLAPGFAVACLLVFGLRAWPAVFLGSLAVWVGVQHSHLVVLLPESAGEALSVVVTVALLRSWGFRPTVERYRDSFYLLAAFAAGRAVASAIDALTVITVASFTTDVSLSAALRQVGADQQGGGLVVTAEVLGFAGRWWANTVAGGVLVVPLLALLAPRAKSARPPRVAESLALVLSVALWLACAYGESASALQPLLLLAALLLVSWSAWRLRPGHANVVTLVLTIAAAAGYGLQLGMFAGGDFRDRLVAEWSFLGLLATASLFLTSLLAVRRRVLHDLEAVSLRYRRVFEGNPFPMWAADGAGRIVLANPAALSLYRYELRQFLALSPDDIRVLAPGVAPRPEEPSADVAHRVREFHRTSDGATLDVEVSRIRVAGPEGVLRIYFVEPLDERNELQFAILNADHLERFRLAQLIRTALVPHLDGVVAEARRIDDGLGGDPIPNPAAIGRIRDDVAAIKDVIRRVTRGLSLMADAANDFGSALRLLQDTLPPGSPRLIESVRSKWLPRLELDRRDQMFRLVEEMVRAAALRPGARELRVAVDDAEAGVELRVETDAYDSGSQMLDEDTLHSISVRAIAAHGRLRVERRVGGGLALHVVFDAATDSTRRLNPVIPAAVARAKATRAMSDPAVGARISPRQWLGRGALLALTYVAVGAPALAFLRVVDSLGHTAQLMQAAPWVPSGIHVVGLVLGGWRLWPAVLLSYVALWWGLAHDSLGAAIVGGAARTLAAVVVALLVRRVLGTVPFNRLKQIAVLAVASALGYALAIPADIYAIGVAGPPDISLSAAELSLAPATAGGAVFGIALAKWYPALRWWINGVIGIVITVPAVTAWTSTQLGRIRAQRVEFIGWLAFLGLCVGAPMAATGFALQLPVLGLGVIAVSWAAVRFGSGLAFVATLLLSLAATARFGLNAAPLPDRAAGPEALWAHVLLLVVTAQLLTSLLVESAAARREARALAQRYRAFIDAVPHALFVCASSSGRIQLANSAAERLLEQPASELLGRALSDFEVVEATEKDSSVDNAWTRRKTQLRTGTGRVVEAELSQVAVDIEEERTTLCFAADVTERYRLTARMIETTERERQHVMRELHDNLGQILTGLTLGAETLVGAAGRSRDSSASAIRFVGDVAAEARAAAQRMLEGISPLQESDGDLLEALRRLPTRLPQDVQARLRIGIEASAPVTMSLSKREHLYNVAQEGVNNALKHAGARLISVDVNVNADAIDVCITDDGVGFDPAQATEGLGLDSMRLRAAALGGSVAVSAAPGVGTELRIHCPQREDDGPSTPAHLET